MQIVSDLSELYELEPLKTEYYSSKLLRDWTNDYPVTFVDYPWSVILNRGIKVELPKVDKGFVVCQHIDFEKLIDIWYNAGITEVFSPHCTKETHNYNYCWKGPRDMGVDIKPYPHIAYNRLNTYENVEKEFDISFCGAVWTHPVRQRLLDLGNGDWKDKCRIFVMDTGKWHLEKSHHERESFEKFYSSLMSKSIFSLCPRGTGPGTIRFWESLAHGSIPIVISDGWELPISKTYSWDSAIIRVEENKIHTIPDLILNISNRELPKMSYRCRELYKEFSSWNIINPIRYYLEDIYDKERITA